MGNSTSQTEFFATNVSKSVPGEMAMALDINGQPQAASPTSGIPIMDAYGLPVVTNWNSSTALNTAVTMNTAGMDNVAVTAIPGGTITAGAITFELYDGYNWFTIKSARESSYNTDSVFNAVGNSQQAWTVPVAGFPQFRVRLSTQLTGTAPTLIVTTIVSSAPDVSVVTAGLDPLQSIHPGARQLTNVQNVAIGASSAQSAVVQSTTNRVTLMATIACWVNIGSNPTAVANTAAGTGASFYLPAGYPMPDIMVTPGVSKIANIQSASGGMLSIIESS